MRVRVALEGAVGAHLEIEVCPRTTGRDLKRQVSQHWGVPCLYQALRAGEEAVEDDAHLAGRWADRATPLEVVVSAPSPAGADTLEPEASLRRAGFHPATRLAGGAGRSSAFRVLEEGARDAYTARAICLTDMEQEARESVEDEVELLRGLAAHPNLADCCRSFWDGAFCFLLTPFEAGVSSLQSVISEARAAHQPPSECLAVEWAGQMLAGLAHLHGRGGVHRSLSPSSIFICEKRRHVVIGDFGISQLLMDAMSSRSASYMSPELLRNEPYAPHTDMWALGCTLFEMRALTLPFQAPSLLDLAIRIIEGEPDWPAWQGLPALQAVVSRLLVKCDGARPSAAELLELACFAGPGGLLCAAGAPKQAWAEVAGGAPDSAALQPGFAARRAARRSALELDCGDSADGLSAAVEDVATPSSCRGPGPARQAWGTDSLVAGRV